MAHMDSEAARIVSITRDCFLEKGYSGTCMDDIVHRTGLPKDEVLSRYPTTDALLDDVIESIVLQGMTLLMAVLEDEHVSPLGKLNMLIKALDEQRAANVQNYLKLQEMGESHFLLRYLTGRVQALTPLMVAIVTTGVDRGVFHCDDPSSLSEMFLCGYFMMLEEYYLPSAPQAQENKRKALLHMLEKGFGVEAGLII